MAKATKYLLEAAQYVVDSQVTVTWNSALSWVSIHNRVNPEDEVFMQGSEADDYLDEVKALCKRYPSLDTYTAVYALAKPYVENCLN